MRRGTTGDTIRRRVTELRERVPGLALRTTLLVGYPGETEADFELLLEFLAEARFERMGAFAYSREEGTPSYDLPGQLPTDVKQGRLERLMYAQRPISRAHNEAAVGQTIEVLVEKRSTESELVWIGRTPQQAPDIDGVVYLGNADGVEPGRIVEATVTQATDYDLVAEV